MAPRYRQADAIIAISRHAADEGIAALGLEPRRVTVAHLGVSEDFRPGEFAGIVNRPYVLLVGEYSRRKGYEKAFAVVSGIADAGYPHRIRVAGRIAPHLAAKVSNVAASAGRPDRIELLGFVDDIVTEYQGAEAVLVTSSAEGFGLPAVEAMACGTPVVAFANTSTSEVVDDAGVLVPDGDVAQMVREVKHVLSDDSWREELVARGLERAKAFRWDRCASAHAEVYRSVAP
jgi:glycosyltransferase involved in cell wall biosynthesis